MRRITFLYMGVAVGAATLVFGNATNNNRPADVNPQPVFAATKASFTPLTHDYVELSAAAVSEELKVDAMTDIVNSYAENLTSRTLDEIEGTKQDLENIDRSILSERKVVLLDETTSKVTALLLARTEQIQQIEREKEMQRQQSANAPVVASKPSANKPAASTQYSHYLELNGKQYPYSHLAQNTAASQSFIDKNPGYFALWTDYHLKVTVDIFYAHNYGAGQLVYNAQVGNIITIKDVNGALVQYQVTHKVTRPISDYYNPNSGLWAEVGTDFDIMIKTCAVTNVTDVILTLKRI